MIRWLLLLLAMSSSSLFPGKYYMEGLATHYDAGSHLGRLTRSEEPYRVDSPTCAVDDELWNELAGKWLLVVTDSGRKLVLRVNDSGYLDEAGTFSWSEAGYYVPDPAGWPVVLDVPETTFRRLSPSGETIHVRVWVMGRFPTLPAGLEAAAVVGEGPD